MLEEDLLECKYVVDSTGGQPLRGFQECMQQWAVHETAFLSKGSSTYVE